MQAQMDTDILDDVREELRISSLEVQAITAERDAAKEHARLAESECAWLRGRIVELEIERDTLLPARRSALAQAFAAAILAHSGEGAMQWTHLARCAFAAADVFILAENEKP